VRASLALALCLLTLTGCQPGRDAWTDEQRAVIASLSLSRLPPLPADPSNRHADDPRAAAFGARLFADPRLSRNGKVSCARCHQPERRFTDGLPRAKGLGDSHRNTPSLLGVAWSPWLFWDGRADSLWSQALGPLSHPGEQGLSEAQLKAVVLQHHAAEYASLFGAAQAQVPAQVAVNVAKSIAAHERSLRLAPTRFDAYADAIARGGDGDATLNDQEQRGLRLFIGQGQCLRCHHGPRFTNNGFHNTGLPPLRGLPLDRGRADGLKAVLASGMNCRSPYSDNPRPSCPQLEFSRPGAAEWVGAFKTPSLRGVSATGPYMHDGRFSTLLEVLEHYNRALNPGGMVGHSELFPLGLSQQELADLEAFLRTL
jgi:cytochrome c peroxidase